MKVKDLIPVYFGFIVVYEIGDSTHIFDGITTDIMVDTPKLLEREVQWIELAYNDEMGHTWMEVTLKGE